MQFHVSVILTLWVFLSAFTFTEAQIISPCEGQIKGDYNLTAWSKKLVWSDLTSCGIISNVRFYCNVRTSDN